MSMRPKKWVFVPLCLFLIFQAPATGFTYIVNLYVTKKGLCYIPVSRKY